MLKKFTAFLASPMRRLAASAVRRRAMSSEADVVDSVRVGRATVPLRPGGSFVPEGYVESLPPRLLPTLEFLAMKDALAQDALLVCAPAERARARHAAFAYAELIRAEAFYVGVSADTTEADLRQRRELVGGGSATWSDGAPVRAALRGGVLILDGLERAERNVLPTLNNLLENREMALDDGRFLVPAARFDAFRGMLGATSSKLEAVHPNFRVVALAAPSPPFDGRPLDPPLRSRLQAGLVPGFDIAELASTDRTLTTAVAAVLELEKQAAARACVEINQWNALSSKNFKPLYLDQIEVDSADFWTDRSLSLSSRSTAEALASKLSHKRTLKSG